METYKVGDILRDKNAKHEPYRQIVRIIPNGWADGADLIQVDFYLGESLYPWNMRVEEMASVYEKVR